MTPSDPYKKCVLRIIRQLIASTLLPLPIRPPPSPLSLSLPPSLSLSLSLSSLSLSLPPPPSTFSSHLKLQKAGELTLFQWASKFYHMAFGVVGVLIFSNFFLAVLGDLLSEESTKVDPVTQDEGKIFLLMWDSILRALGWDVDPVDRLRRLVKGEDLVSE